MGGETLERTRSSTVAEAPSTHDERAVVLIVDADSVERMLAREALEQADFLVKEAEDGAEALRLCCRSLPDLVLIDEGVPEMDGFETCVELRNLPGGTQVPIVLLTGVEDIEAIDPHANVSFSDITNHHGPIYESMKGAH